MSKKPPSDKPPLKVVKQGMGGLAEPSIEQVKQLFMASKNLEWIPFAKAQGWDPSATRAKFPVAEWITQKKEVLALEEAEQIAELVFNHRSRWHRDVLKTLREYPEAADAMLGILKHRENEFISMINEDMEEKSRAIVEGREPKYKFAKVKTAELKGLAEAIRVVVETKHKSLLINDWSVKLAEQFTDPKQFEKNETQMKDTGWKLEVIGGENITSGQMQKLLSQYYDKPMNIHDVIDVAPPEQDEEEDNF